MRTLASLILLSSALHMLAQDSTVPVVTTDTTRFERDWRIDHSPRKATLCSALLPGAGQIYNRKYWKAPIVWAGLGVSYYFIRENNREYNRYKDAYLARIDGDPATIDEFEGEYSAEALANATDQYRRWLEWSYVAFGVVYILNVMDATIDAHFVRFDVSPDLTLDLAPSLPMAAQGALGLTMRLRL